MSPDGLVLRALATTISESLSPHVAGRLASALPENIATYVRAAEHGEHFGIDEVFARVSIRTNYSIGYARQQAQAASHTIGELVDDDTLASVREDAPDIAALLRGQ